MNCSISAASSIHKPDSSMILAEYIVRGARQRWGKSRWGVPIPSRTMCSLVLVLSHVPRLRVPTDAQRSLFPKLENKKAAAFKCTNAPFCGAAAGSGHRAGTREVPEE